MPIEWVGESLPTTYKPDETRPVTPSDRGKPDREQNAALSKRGRVPDSNPYSQSLARQNQRLEEAVFAKEVMQTRMHTIEPEQALLDAVRLFAEHHIDHLPVKNRGGKLVGILSQHDVMLTLADGRQHHAPRNLTRDGDGRHPLHPHRGRRPEDDRLAYRRRHASLHGQSPQAERLDLRGLRFEVQGLRAISLNLTP
jgi:CBS domain